MSSTEPRARIVDRGYRSYDGRRGGITTSMRAVAWHTAQRVLGLRRSPWAKIFPLLVVGFAFVPAVVFIGLAVLIGDNLITEEILPSYGEYYGFVSLAMLLFSAFVAPEALIPDRRSGLLGLYLASPLDRTTYVLAKLGAVLGLLGIVTLGPPLLMLIAFTLEGGGPDGVGELLVLVGQMLAAAGAVAAFYTALSLAISSVTDRKGVASASFILLMIVSSVIPAALVEAADVSPNVFALNVFSLPLEVAIRIYGEATGPLPELDTATMSAAFVVWLVASLLVIRVRYQRLRAR